MLVALGEKGVKTLDDLADLASDELVEIVGEANMDEATANDVIMAARAHWFAEEFRRRRQWRCGGERPRLTERRVTRTSLSRPNWRRSRKPAHCGAAS